MKYTLVAAILLIATGATAQDITIINGTITGMPDGTRVWMIPDSYSGSKDSTIVQNGHFRFTIPLHTPNPAYNLRLSREWMPDKWMSFCLEAGSMNIDIKNDFRHCRIKGGTVANDQGNFLKFLDQQGYYRQMDALRILEKKATAGKDTALINRASRESQRLYDLKEDLLLQWVAEHPNSLVSAFFLQMICRQPLIRRAPFFDKLTSSAKNNEYGQTLQQSIDGHNATRPGKTAPDFSQADTSGNNVSLQDFRGKYVLIDFWASWCVPCRAENPTLVAAYNKYKDKGFTIIGVSLDEKRDKWVEAIVKDGLPWIHVSDLRFWKNAIAVQYNIHSVPDNFLLDPQGKIIARNLRGDKLEKELAAVLH